MNQRILSGANIFFSAGCLIWIRVKTIKPPHDKHGRFNAKKYQFWSMPTCFQDCYTLESKANHTCFHWSWQADRSAKAAPRAKGLAQQRSSEKSFDIERIYLKLRFTPKLPFWWWTWWWQSIGTGSQFQLPGQPGTAGVKFGSWGHLSYLFRIGFYSVFTVFNPHFRGVTSNGRPHFGHVPSQAQSLPRRPLLQRLVAKRRPRRSFGLRGCCRGPSNLDSVGFWGFLGMGPGLPMEVFKVPTTYRVPSRVSGFLIQNRLWCLETPCLGLVWLNLWFPFETWLRRGSMVLLFWQVVIVSPCFPSRFPRKLDHRHPKLIPHWEFV